jgi:hypothetical protein
MNSKLLYRINLNNDKVYCIFIYFVSWFNFKIELHTFELSKDLTMSMVKKVFDKIENEYDRKYRI